MKKNIFYLIIGFVALALFAIFWYSVESFTPFLFMIAFVIGVVLIYLVYRG